MKKKLRVIIQLEHKEWNNKILLYEICGGETDTYFILYNLFSVIKITNLSRHYQKEYDRNTLILKKLWNKTGRVSVLYVSYKYPKNKDGMNTIRLNNAKSFNSKWINVNISDDIKLPNEICRKLQDLKKLFILSWTNPLKINSSNKGTANKKRIILYKEILDIPQRKIQHIKYTDTAVKTIIGNIFFFIY